MDRLRWLLLLVLAGSVVFAAAAPASSPPAKSGRVDGWTSGRGRGATVASSPTPSPAASSAVKSFGRMPLAFEENRGQTDARVRFLSRGKGYTLFLTGDEAVLRLNEPGAAGDRSSGPHPRPLSSQTAGSKIVTRLPAGEGSLRSKPGSDRSAAGSQSPLSSSSPGSTFGARPDSWRGAGGEDLNHAAPSSPQASVLEFRLLGARRQPRTTGEAPLPGKSNYFLGNDPAKWQRNVPQYGKVRCEQVYCGIDAVYYGNQEGRLEYDFELAPGADPSQIRLAFSGARGIKLAANGDLLLRTAAGTLRQHRPVAYQLFDGTRVPVTAGYVLTPSPRSGGGRGAWAQRSRGAGRRRSGSSTRPYVHTPTQITLDLGAYDRSRSLVIDPVLAFSTYLGGSERDVAVAVATDSLGNVYVAGFTTSATFPTTPGAGDTTHNGSNDLFVTKFDPTGSTLLYSTFLGGVASDEMDYRPFAVDATGNAYLSGTVNSADFPTTPGAFDQTPNGRNDAFVAKLTPDGATLVYSTLLGGLEQDRGRGLAVDGSGNVVVVGITDSPDFPLEAPLDFRVRLLEGFVTKLNATGSALLYSTFLGGSELEGATAVALDGAGSAIVCGDTSSPDFPTANPFQPAMAGTGDAFVAKIVPDGSAFIYSTYLGGAVSGPIGEQANAIAADAAGNAYVLLWSDSTDLPTVDALQPANAGAEDCYVAKLNPAGSALLFATYLGGSAMDQPGGIALDAAGNMHIAGGTRSTDYPTANPIQAAHAGGVLSDVFITKLRSDGAALLYSTYLGGTDFDGAVSLAVDGAGAAYIVGRTRSTDFPIANPYQPNHAGGPATNPEDGFLAKITDGPPPPPPSAPSNLTATTVSQARIDLAWGDNSDNESGFRVERWNGSVFAPIAAVGANATSYSNTGLSPATTYRYRVLAFNAGGNSPPSNTAEATTLPNPPGAPSNLVATALSQTEIRLTWNENANNEDAIEVWRSTGGPFALHAGLGPNQTSYLDQGLAPATLYIYQVRATNAGGDSAFSNQAGATTLPNPPAAPSGLTATAVSGSQINLAWGDNSSNEAEFVLEVSTDGGTTFAFLATRGANVTSYSHAGLAPETTRHYRVKARNAGGESAWSNVASATTPQVPPATPTNLTATALSSSEVRLNWNDVGGEQGFRIERRQGNDPFAFVANVGPNTTTYTDGGLQANKVYVYRVLAFNQAGNSDWSNEASARTLRSRPSPPHSLTAAAISATQVDLAWSDENQDEQGFLLERSENAGVSWSQVASLPANVTRATDTSAQGGRNYQYRLKAWNDVGQSDPSNVASVSTPAAVALASLTVTPAAVRGRRNATGKVTLTGPAPSGGVAVTLASSNAAATVPSSVTVAAGATEATFTVTTARVRRNTRVTLTATLAAVQKTATLTVKK